MDFSKALEKAQGSSRGRETEQFEAQPRIVDTVFVLKNYLNFPTSSSSEFQIIRQPNVKKLVVKACIADVTHDGEMHVVYSDMVNGKVIGIFNGTPQAINQMSNDITYTFDPPRDFEGIYSATTTLFDGVATAVGGYVALQFEFHR
jgi:hypothetical protein